MNRWIIVPLAGGLYKTNMLISSGNWPGLQGPHEVHLCQGHREGQRALAAGHGLHLFLEVQVVLEALVDQEAPCGNIVVYIFFLDLSLLKSTLLIIFLKKITPMMSLSRSSNPDPRASGPY